MDAILHGLAQAIMALSGYIVNNKEVIGMVVAAGGGVSLLVLEPIKRMLGLSDTKLSDHVHVLRFIPVVRSLPTVTVLHYLFLIIVAGIHYVQGSHSSSPIIVLGQALIILGSNQFVYPTLVKPVATLMADSNAEANVRRAQATSDRVLGEFQG